MKKDISNKTSIIVCAYDTLRIQRQMTSACLGNIEKYTNRDEYELILIDQRPNPQKALGRTSEPSEAGLDTRHHRFTLDKHIMLNQHIGMSAAMNRGYKESNPDYPYICFMHNDVFVWEGWLPTMRNYLEKGTHQIIMPHQGPTTREEVLESYKEEHIMGNDDAGLTIMSKKTFEKTGGWDERFKAIYMESAFRIRHPEKYYCTKKCLITHIGCGTVYADAKREEQDYKNEANLYNDLRSYNTGKKTNYL